MKTQLPGQLLADVVHLFDTAMMSGRRESWSCDQGPATVNHGQPGPDDDRQDASFALNDSRCVVWIFVFAIDAQLSVR